MKYAYKDVEEFEYYFNGKMSESFRAGWRMARVTDEQLGIRHDGFLVSNIKRFVKPVVQGWQWVLKGWW